MARDWVQWHDAYDNPNSSMPRRLAAVVRFLEHVLEVAPPGPVRVLSLCAGDGRDLVAAATGHARRRDVTGVLVELDHHLAATAADRIRGSGLGLDVRQGDAANPQMYADIVPVDVLLLAGIFGNVYDDDILRVVSAVPALCATNAAVVWTRHRREPDITPTVRSWFVDVGCVPVDFASEGPGAFAVGYERFHGVHNSRPVESPLFTFRDDQR